MDLEECHMEFFLLRKLLVRGQEILVPETSAVPVPHCNQTYGPGGMSRGVFFIAEIAR
jgi:hypothetical protein